MAGERRASQAQNEKQPEALRLVDAWRVEPGARRLGSHGTWRLYTRNEGNAFKPASIYFALAGGILVGPLHAAQLTQATQTCCSQILARSLHFPASLLRRVLASCDTPSELYSGRGFRLGSWVNVACVNPIRPG